MQEKYKTLKFEQKNGIGILTLNAPNKLNACSKLMRSELWSFWSSMQNDTGCRVIIMTGEGKSFCAGQDIDEMDDKTHPFYKWTIEEIYAFQHEISDVVFMMRRAPQPVIAAVRGYAAGGGFSMAIAADIRIADTSAKFVAAYVNIGLSGADMSSSFYFPRQVNLGIALEYLYTGDTIDAKTGLRIGFVNHVVAPGKLMAKAQEIADKMVSKSTLGLRMTKEAVNQNISTTSLESAMYFENRNQVLCLASGPIRNPFGAKKRQ